MIYESVLIVFFISSALTLGIVSNELGKKLRIHVCSILLCFGIILRLICPAVGYQALVDNLDETNPNTVLLLLLPPLIYQGGISTDWHSFKKELGQIVPMATSVMLLCSLFQALVIKYILNYDFYWFQITLLCVLLCATDYMMTRRTLKNLHMDSSFNTLVQGESFLNQITILNIFTILNSNSNPLTNFGLSILQLLYRLSIGFLIGLGFSYTMGKAIRRIVNDFIQEFNLTLATTFLLFYVAEINLEASGVMAVVTFALYMSAYGKTLISPTVEKRYMFVWDFLSRTSENISFVFGGFLIGKELSFSDTLSPHDIYKVVVLYISQLVIRLFVVFLHYPVLKKFGYGIDLPKIVILTLGGIKGVISTLMAIIASKSTEHSAQFRSLSLFLIIGVTFLTILVNPFLLKFAEFKFKIIGLSDIQENLLLKVTSQIMQRTNKKLDLLKKSREFPLVKWDEVIDIAGPRELVIAIMKRSKNGKKILMTNPKLSAEELIDEFCENIQINDSMMSREMRTRFYASLRGIYWDEFESGQCMGQTSLILINSTSFLQNKVYESIQDWNMIEKEILNPKLMNFYRQFKERPIINGMFRNLMCNQIIRAYDAASTFLKAHRRARGLFENMEIDHLVLESLLNESLKQESLCENFLQQNIYDTYPEIISEVQSKMACYTLLISQRKLISKIFQQGVIKHLEYNYLLTSIDKNFKALTFLTSPKIPLLKETLKSRFKKAKNKDINELMKLIEEKHLKPGCLLFEDKTENTGAHLILTGKVREYGDWIDQELGIGNIVGVQNLLPGSDSVYNTTAQSLTVVTSVKLPKNMLDFECFEEDIYKESAEEFIIINKDKFNLKNAKNDQIIFLVGKCYIKKVYQGSLISLKRGGVVIKGRIRTDKGCFSLLRPTRKKIESIDDALLLIFPHNFSRILISTRNFTEAVVEFFIKNAKRKEEFKPFYALKSTSNRRETKIYKKIKKYANSKLSIDSLDKMLDV